MFLLRQENAKPELCCLAVPKACCGCKQPVRDLAQRLKSVVGLGMMQSPSVGCACVQVEDVLEMYTRITGRVLDLSSKDPARAQAQE